MSKLRLSNSNKSIVLVGHMGSGKSTIGKNLSKKLGIDFIDSDKEIELREKIKISNIFSLHGEKYFRNLEEKINLKLCLLYTSPSPRDATLSRMPSSA